MPGLPANLIFQDPLWFCALLVFPLLYWLRGRRSVPVLVIPFAAAWRPAGLRGPSRWPVVLASLGLVALIVALARPQQLEDKRVVNVEGYDIMLAIDLSSSMLAEDYERGLNRINRLQAVQPIIQSFISKRPNDRIGLVVFSGRAYTLAPLTFDHDWLGKQVDRLKTGLIEDGTAIGDGLGVALTRLEQARRSDGTRRVGAFVVLLTDGANNQGSLAPLQAGEIARSRSVPVYTISAGTNGVVPYPIFDEAGNRIGTGRQMFATDEPTLRLIAENTGGRFFHADDLDTAEAAFREIDRSRKIEFQSRSYLLTTEWYLWLAVPGGGLLLLAALAPLLGGGGLHNRTARTQPAPPAAGVSPTRTAASAASTS